VFKIFYPDGKEYDSQIDEGPPPARGVQIILQTHPQIGPYMQHRGDYYIFDNGYWRGCDISGLKDFLFDNGIVKFGDVFHEILVNNTWHRCDIFGLLERILQTGLVLFGLTISNEEYQSIYQKAKIERDSWK